MQQQTARNLNVIGLWIIMILLGLAYYFQFTGSRFPCPLCLMQRLAMVGVGFGLLLNIRFGVRSSHYGLIILSAMFGGTVSIRQIFLHIVPGTGSYGEAVMGLHLYTWALVAFYCVIAVIAIMMLFEKQFITKLTASSVKPWGGFMKFSALILILLALGNVGTTFLECGVKQYCPDNPTGFRLLFNK